LDYFYGEAFLDFTFMFKKDASEDVMRRTVTDPKVLRLYRIMTAHATNPRITMRSRVPSRNLTSAFSLSKRA